MIRSTAFLVHVTAALFLSSGLNTAAGATSSKAVDDYVRHEMAERRIVGMAVAVIQHGKIRKIGTYGWASLEFTAPVRAATPFSVASISKSVTAVGIMMLVEAGKLRLDDPIGSHLSDLPATWQTVTVRQLLSHTSGLPNVSKDDYTTEAIAPNLTEALRILADRPLESAPGSNYRYSGTNYVLLGQLIERLSGKSYTAFCAERLFAPAMLRTAQFGDARTVVRERATSYTPFRFDGPRPTAIDHVEVLNATMPEMTYPGGGLNISIADFAQWLVALLNHKLIGEASLQTLWTPTTLADGSIFQLPSAPSLWRAYGLGWVLGLEDPHPFAGGTGGIRSAFFVYHKDDLAVIVLTNTQGARPESLVQGVAEKYFARP